MPSEMPSLGSEPKKSSLPGVLITAVVVGLLAGGAYWWRTRNLVEAPPAPVAAAPVDPSAPVVAAVPPVVDPNAPAPIPAVPGAPAVAPTAPVAAAPAKAPVDAQGLKSFTATINGPFEAAIVTAVGKQVGQPLTQVINRSLVWWLRVPGDLLKGDEISVVYEERANQEPLVHAVRFVSRKFSKTWEAYLFKSKEEAFARFYEPSGEELEQRLVDGPLDSWEQVTSLLKDGRKHKGVDFKTSVGTPVKATFDGTIGRKNWSFRGNGNSIEVIESGGQGRVAMFLHLSEVDKGITPGQRVKKGDVIAKSGNTGHSFAPHLHYQLMKGDKVIDPFESHKTFKKSIDAADKPKLEAEITRLKGVVGSAPGQVAGGFGRQ